MEATQTGRQFSEQTLFDHLRLIHKNNMGTFGEILSDYTKLSRENVKARRSDKPKSEVQLDEQLMKSAIQKSHQEHLNSLIAERDEKTKQIHKLNEEKQQLVDQVTEC